MYTFIFHYKGLTLSYATIVMVISCFKHAHLQCSKIPSIMELYIHISIADGVIQKLSCLFNARPV